MRAYRRLHLGIAILLLPAGVAAQDAEYRLGVFLRASDRNLQAAQSLGRSSATLRGAELFLRNDVVALSASYATGDFGVTSTPGAGGPLREGRATLGLGPHILTLEGGYYRRARGTSLSEQAENLVHLGARSTIRMGPSGLVISLAAAAVLRNDSAATGSGASSSGMRPVGWTAETGLLYQAPRGMPFFASLGYRYERLRSNRNLTPVSHEELSAVVFGIGLRLVPRRREAPPSTS